MTDEKPAAPRSGLFAQKGQAAPAPAVGYVGVTDLRGKLNRRHKRLSFAGEDRRHSSYDSVFGYRPCTPEIPPETPLATTEAPPATTGPAPDAESAAYLSSLIHRRLPSTAAQGAQAAGAGGAQTTPREPERAAPAVASGPVAPEAARQEAPPTPAAAPTPAPVRKKRKRRQLTVRLQVDVFERFKALAKETGHTYQDLLARATKTYVNRGEDTRDD